MHHRPAQPQTVPSLVNRRLQDGSCTRFISTLLLPQARPAVQRHRRNKRLLIPLCGFMGQPQRLTPRETCTRDPLLAIQTQQSSPLSRSRTTQRRP
ncbi:hypothetical protein VTK73DRAFT_6050 [Phialemonium thermophilum]|uniref:Uncharacterized protein n=1 Tax=Phialemonium thermophilum TaxID=223376 RepID=A0ABR3XX54_9PEZI